MARQPTPDRYDSETQRGLQLGVRAGTPRPPLDVVQEAALLGSVTHFTDIQENRLKSKALAEKNTKPIEYVDTIWPTPDLYSIAIPGHLDVIRSVPDEEVPVDLTATLEQVPDGVKKLIKRVEIDLGGIDPGTLHKCIVDRFGAAAGRRMTPRWDKDELDTAVGAGLVERETLFTPKPKARQWLIKLYGPKGEVIERASQLKE